MLLFLMLIQIGFALQIMAYILIVRTKQCVYAIKVSG